MGTEDRRYNLDVMMLAVLHQRELCMINAIKVKILGYISTRTLSFDRARGGSNSRWPTKDEWGKSLDWQAHGKDACLVSPLLQNQRMTFRLDSLHPPSQCASGWEGQWPKCLQKSCICCVPAGAYQERGGHSGCHCCPTQILLSGLRSHPPDAMSIGC